MRGTRALSLALSLMAMLAGSALAQTGAGGPTLDAARAIGNIGESYDRNMGPTSAVELPRGANNIWTKGGLLYALPMR